ncbi:hypothetical protein BC835DRAFT_595044 [Cytidiella melzeri]|nr:hypothetical protein BC835DRAFT_595044 [Cytidiella melzeri]
MSNSPPVRLLLREERQTGNVRPQPSHAWTIAPDIQISNRQRSIFYTMGQNASCKLNSQMRVLLSSGLRLLATSRKAVSPLPIAMLLPQCTINCKVNFARPTAGEPSRSDPSPLPTSTDHCHAMSQNYNRLASTLTFICNPRNPFRTCNLDLAKLRPLSA